jgi:hypothetical protein
VNAGMVSTQRLPGYNVADIAFALRYYPEVTLFLPLVLALALRQGEERRPESAWERRRLGQAALGAVACWFAVSLAIWAPGIVRDSPGVAARSWYDNLRGDMASVSAKAHRPRLIDSETPPYLIEWWMAPNNRVSSLLGLTDVAVEYNDVSDPIYFVRSDGHLERAAFKQISVPIAGGSAGPGLSVIGRGSAGPKDTCLQGKDRLVFRPSAEIDGAHLAIKVLYAAESRGLLAAYVDAMESDRPDRYFELRRFQTRAELVDLSTHRLAALTLDAQGGRTCIERLEIGSLEATRP